jgi:hypothetical protein
MQGYPLLLAAYTITIHIRGNVMIKKIGIFAACAFAAVTFSAQAQMTEGARVRPGNNKPGHMLHFSKNAAGKVIITSTDGTAWLWDPATGDTTSSTPEPIDNTNPIGGIGVVIKKNPGGSAERTIPIDGHGNAMLPTDLEDGKWLLTVRVQRMKMARAQYPYTGDMDDVIQLSFASTSGNIQGMAINEKGTAGTKPTTKSTK